MKSLILFALLVVLAPFSACAHAIDARVVQVHLPDEDVAVSYGERAPVFTVTLRAKSSSVAGSAVEPAPSGQ